MSDGPGLAYAFIIDYKTQTGGRSPTIREIAAACGVASSNTAFVWLRELAADGRIVLSGRGRSRHIAIPGERWTPGKGNHDF